MANELTGDFDVVAEFAIPAANRVLAAMHRSERFLHSITIRVDDNRPPGSLVATPTIVGSVDTFGDPTVDHTRIGTPIPVSEQFAATDPIYAVLDPVVNPELVGAVIAPVVPSRLQGRAQLQLSPPTIEVPDASGTNIRVRLNIMSRYFPDPQSPPVAEFIRGDLQITAAVNQVSSQTANVVDIDIKADNVSINFSPTWSNRPLSAADVAGINQAIRNALKTSFVPSNTTLPSNINHMQFKTLQGAQSAIAVLLDMDGGPGNPGSATNVFLRPGDDFAFAAGRDFVQTSLPTVRDHRPHTAWVYTYFLDEQTTELQDGRILLTIKGHAHTPWLFLPNFSFTAKQAFTLKPVASMPGGPLNTAELALLGDISLTTSSTLVNWFKGLFMDRLRAARQEKLDAVQPTVRDKLDAGKNLGGFLTSLLTRARKGHATEPQEHSLAYTSAEIRSSGIVLHGSLAVMDWPPARVEFEEIPVNAGSGPGGPGGAGGLIATGPDYSALKTWIPGGVIQRYEWSILGATQPFHVDDHKFVYVQPPPLSTTDSVFMAAPVGFRPVCLTVKGTRIASSGPAVAQPVSASVCGYNWFPVVGGLLTEASVALPLIALTHPGPRGLVEVAGHTPAKLAEPGRGAPNLIVHFADEKTADHLEFLGQALRESKRADAATAILAVLSAEQMARARHAEGVLYAEDQERAWERVFGVKATRRPLTLIVAPNGKVVWQHEGELERETLSAALRKVLESRRAVTPRVLRPAVRIGQLPPDFLFEYAPGRPLRLRKLQGRPTTLVFWRSASKASIETVRDVQITTGRAGGRGPVVVAINDGEAAELATRVAAENGLSGASVADPERRIALAYGVNMWPTIVMIDAFGLVRELRYGRLGGEHVESASKGNAAGVTPND
jgi:hypothetical protein